MKARSGKTNGARRALLGGLAKKIAENIAGGIRGKKRPFGGKAGRRKKDARPQPPPQAEPDDAQPAAETYEEGGQGGNPFSDFFYVNDGFIARFEDDDILRHIQSKYPQFNPGRQGETALKNAVIKLLQDSEFMEGTLARYSMTIMDFFKFLFRLDSSIYRGNFIPKIQKAIKNRKYAAVKQHKQYKFQKQARRTRRARPA